MQIAFIDTHSNRRSDVRQAIANAGYTATCWMGNSLSIQHFVQLADAVVLDMETACPEAIEQLALVNKETPKPLIVLTQKAAAKVSRLAATRGVDLFVTDELTPTLLKSLITTSVANFERNSSLREELEKNRLMLENTRQISRAKALLMEHADMTEALAHQHIRRKAMRDRVTMREVADGIIELANVQLKACA